MKAFVPVVLAVLAVGASAAAAAPIRWTDARMAATVQTLNYPASDGSTATVNHCKGLGTPIRHMFARFACQVTVRPGGNGSPNLVSVWVRPLAHGRVCGTLNPTIPCQPVAASKPA